MAEKPPKKKSAQELEEEIEGLRQELARVEEENRQRIGADLDILFAEARSWEYMVLNEASRIEMQQIMNKMREGGWEVHTFIAMPDPAHPKGRQDLKPPAHMEIDHMDNLAVIYVALMRRGGTIVRK